VIENLLNLGFSLQVGKIADKFAVLQTLNLSHYLFSFLIAKVIPI